MTEILFYLNLKSNSTYFEQLMNILELNEIIVKEQKNYSDFIILQCSIFDKKIFFDIQLSKLFINCLYDNIINHIWTVEELIKEALHNKSIYKIALEFHPTNKKLIL